MILLVVNLLVLLANILVFGQVVKIYTEVLKMRALTSGDRWDGKGGPKGGESFTS